MMMIVSDKLEASTETLTRDHMPYAQTILEEMEKASKVPDLHAPVLGGCTRWVTDLFDSVLYIKSHLLVIKQFVAQEIEGQNPSESLMALGKLLNATPTKTIITECDKFLEEAKIFREALQKFSNKTDKVCISEAYNTLLELKTECEKRKGKFEIAFDHHIERLTEKDGADMNYFATVRFLDPVQLIRSDERPADRAFDKLFNKIGFLDDDLAKFLSTTNFWVDGNDMSMPAPDEHTALKWWQQLGVKLFPRMAPIAIGLLTPPPVVNQVDSFFSVMDASFTDRQTRMGKDLLTNILFITSNMPSGTCEEDL